jgi:RNA polymerase sigma-70 factor (ECF subfamily)
VAEEADPEARFRSIFLAEAAYVGNSLRRLGVRERDLEDVTHDVFLVIHRHLGDYDPSRPLRPWIFGIAARVALAYRRRAGHRLEVVQPEIETVDDHPGADDELTKRRALGMVIEALDAIAEERRPVFVMHDIDKCSMPEIAAALGIPLNTGYSRLRLARREFSDAVARLRARRGIK